MTGNTNDTREENLVLETKQYQSVMMMMMMMHKLKH